MDSWTSVQHSTYFSPIKVSLDSTFQEMFLIFGVISTFGCLLFGKKNSASSFKPQTFNYISPPPPPPHHHHALKIKVLTTSKRCSHQRHNVWHKSNITALHNIHDGITMHSLDFESSPLLVWDPIKLVLPYVVYHWVRDQVFHAFPAS